MAAPEVAGPARRRHPLKAVVLEQFHEASSRDAEVDGADLREPEPQYLAEIRAVHNGVEGDVEAKALPVEDQRAIHRLDGHAHVEEARNSDVDQLLSNSFVPNFGNTPRPAVPKMSPECFLVSILDHRRKMWHGPLHDLRIVAIEQYAAGPYGTLLRAELGAEVIKIEEPGGEVGRTVPP